MKRRQNSDDFSLSPLELTRSYYGACQESSCKYMMLILRECRIMNITKEDCEDMYNEFFTIAIQAYKPGICTFKHYLKKIVEYKTLDFVRRVISKQDPLFYCGSLDKKFDDGKFLLDIIGSYDTRLDLLESIVASSSLEEYGISALDKAILYYRGIGFSLQEIAEIMNVSLSTARRRIIAQRKNKKLLTGLNKLD